MHNFLVGTILGPAAVAWKRWLCTGLPWLTVILIIIGMPTLSIICSNVTRLGCEIPGPDYRVIISDRYQSLRRDLISDQPALTTPRIPHWTRTICPDKRPLIHCRKLSVLALSVSGKTFWATEEKLQLFSKKLLFTVKQCEVLPGLVAG